mmetsp:Transcript_111937/g.256663  ORF Transcript_111937/g.256663 Transcript_111937/m.256663 type:complete len:273 (+) Transcript_111937:404-1222(+)
MRALQPVEVFHASTQRCCSNRIPLTLKARKHRQSLTLVQTTRGARWPLLLHAFSKACLGAISSTLKLPVMTPTNHQVMCRLQPSSHKLHLPSQSGPSPLPLRLRNLISPARCLRCRGVGMGICWSRGRLFTRIFSVMSARLSWTRERHCTVALLASTMFAMSACVLQRTLPEAESPLPFTQSPLVRRIPWLASRIWIGQFLRQPLLSLRLLYHLWSRLQRAPSPRSPLIHWQLAMPSSQQDRHRLQLRSPRKSLGVPAQRNSRKTPLPSRSP